MNSVNSRCNGKIVPIVNVDTLKTHVALHPPYHSVANAVQVELTASSKPEFCCPFKVDAGHTTSLPTPEVVATNDDQSTSKYSCGPRTVLPSNQANFFMGQKQHEVRVLSQNIIMVPKSNDATKNVCKRCFA